jgi:hypothetical protein
LGDGYTAAKDHDHDGTNSALSAGVADGTVTQAKLSTTFGSVNTTNKGITNLTLPGGYYGFFPNISSDDGASVYWGYDSTSGLGKWAATTTSTSYLAIVSCSYGGAGAGSVNMRQYYVQASPPYHIGNIEWGHFLFMLRNRSGDLIAAYEAPDPPWAYNGLDLEITDAIERIKTVPHCFADYFDRNPADDGLEIALVDLRDMDVDRWRKDCAKARKRSIFEDLAGNVSPQLVDKGVIRDNGIPNVPGFSNRVKLKERI